MARTLSPARALLALFLTYEGLKHKNVVLDSEWEKCVSGSAS